VPCGGQVAGMPRPAAQPGVAAKARQDLLRGDGVSRCYGSAVAPRDPWYDRSSWSRRPSPLNARSLGGLRAAKFDPTVGRPGS
jgi:hypothetical protein